MPNTHKKQVFSLPREGFVRPEQKIFQVSNDRLDEGKDDIVGVEDIDVGGALAQLDAGDGGGLGQRPRRAVHGQGPLDGVNEGLLAHVLR